MNSTNILYLIASGLEFADLLKLAQVNKVCNIIAGRQELWRRECYRLFLCDLELFDLPLLSDTQDQLTISSNDPSKIDWKNLVKSGIQAKNGITALYGDTFSKEQTRTFADCLFATLIDPPMPIPSLTREGKAFSSFLQDALAQKLYVADAGPYMEGMGDRIDAIFNFMADLDQHSDKLFSEVSFMQFSSSLDRDLLAIARWHLRKPKTDKVEESSTIPAESPQSTSASLTHEEFNAVLESIHLTLTSASSQAPKPFLLQIYYAVKYAISWFCKLTRSVLTQCSDEYSMLREYVKRVTFIQWSAYSAAISTVETSCDPYNLLFNDIYDVICEGLPRKPDYSILRTMVIIWRRKVYAPLRNSIFSSILYLLSKQREHLIYSLSYKSSKLASDRSFLVESKRIESEFYLLQKSIESMLDLSVNEHSVHMSDHSKFYTDGVYNHLHERVISHTEQFYIHSLKNLKPLDKLAVLKADEKLANRLFISSTYAEISKMNLDAKISTLWDYFLKKYIHFEPTKASKIHVRTETLNMILYSEFGRKLFNFKPTENAKQVISVFIEHLIASDDLPLINEFLTDYDKIQSGEELSEADLLIENRLSSTGFSMEMPPEELALYSMGRDISVHELSIV